MTKTDEETYVDIGFMDESAMRGGSAEAAGLKWVSMTDKEILFWYQFATALRFGDDEDSVAYTFDEYIPSIFDTGTSLALVPKKIAADFFGRLLDG